ncbi:MAG TPA: gliding motility-associated C-terminal domain-containing protein, partial [Bacteroidia bacterium]|nr:gliding motility-associated C-terminal domain-containing protein [Bacteroidia bacterium]
TAPVAGSTVASPYVVSALNPGDVVVITVTPTGAGCFKSTTATCSSIPCTPSTVTVPANITVCNGGIVPSTAFTSTPAGATISWTNSDPAIGIAASGTGNIASFTATNLTGAPITATITVTPTIAPCAGTASTYTITVNPTITPTFDPLPPICSGAIAPVLPTMSLEHITGAWSPATVNNTETGSYKFIPTAGSCAVASTLTQTITPLPTASIDKPNVIQVYTPVIDSVVLRGHASPGSIAWSILEDNGVNTSSFSNQEQPKVLPPSPTGNDADPLTVTTHYLLTVTSAGGCQDTASVYVQVIQKLIIPNIFSPNGDGVNETFDIAHIHEFPDVDVSIFNRYGQFIFESHGYNIPWDGNYHGQPLPVGTYFYIIKTTPDAKPISGPISIVR